jgi:hypothetical protein
MHDETIADISELMAALDIALHRLLNILPGAIMPATHIFSHPKSSDCATPLVCLEQINFVDALAPIR